MIDTIEPVALGDELVRRKEIAAALRISNRTLSRWISTGEFPRPDLRLGERYLRWRAATLRNWISANSGKIGGGR